MTKCYNYLFILLLVGIIGCSSDGNTKRYNLTTTATPSKGGTVSPTSGEFEKGQQIEVSASPNEHWEFDGWQGGLSGDENPQTITMDADKDVAALFVKRDYPLAITTEGQGTVVEQVIQQKSTDYPHGTMVELTAEPADGWEFEGWQGDIETAENPTTVTIDGETQITVVFSGVDYPLEITIEGEGTVDEQVVQPKTDYPVGTVVELTGNAEENWIFSEWSGDLEGEDNPAQITVDGPKEVTATFLRTYNLTTNADPEQGGTITPEAGQYVRDTTLEVEAVPSQGWEFVEWEGNFSGTVNPFNLTMNGDKTITAKFERIDYPLTITIEGEGSVEQEVVQAKTTEYPYETVVQLTPVPDEAWVFGQWQGDVSSTEEVIEVQIEGETNITVQFTEMVYLADNGNTIMCPKGRVGEVGIVDGEEYEVVDRELLDQRIEEEGDVTKVCTSLITDMSNLFDDNEDFNQQIGNWDVSNVKNMSHLFYRADNFNQPIGDWDVSQVETMNSMFLMALSFNQALNSWDVSNVTDMSRMFSGSQFNQPIEEWDVGNVTDMGSMFFDTPFNQPIGNWDVSNVTNMESIFRFNSYNHSLSNWNVSNVTNMSFMFRSSSFNLTLDDWDVSSVTNMDGMFFNSSFNQSLSNWNVANVTIMRNMFNGSSFNQSIGNWDVSNVTNMQSMFGSSSFNQPIGDWNVGKVTNMESMFYNSLFNQPISKWNVSSVNNMSRMFALTENFNQEIDEWDVSNVGDMSVMFASSDFNQPIGDWDVSNVGDMSAMFNGSQFNQPIGEWDVSNVTDMDFIFFESDFNQDISIWCVTNIPTEPDFFSTNSPLTVENKPIWGTCPE